MPYKDYTQQLACQRRIYGRYTEAQHARVRQRKAEKKRRNQAFVNEYKQQHGCLNHPEVTDPALLHCHHRDPSQKTAGISVLCNDAAAIVRIAAELEKCDVVCANCHAKLHR